VMSARVVIIGGGLSGLIAFAEAHLKNMQVDLLDSRSFLGGNEKAFDNVEISESNKEFLKQLQIDSSSITKENAFTVLKEGLLKLAHSKSVKDFRMILNAEVASILTDPGHKVALGANFQRTSPSPIHGKTYVTESKIFGDAIICALSEEGLKSLLRGFGKIDSGRVQTSEGNILGDLYVSTHPLPTTLNELIDFSRQAGKLAGETRPKTIVSNSTRQPVPYIDKTGVYHGVALKPTEWISLTLENRMQLNRFNHLFRFKLLEPNQMAGLFCGQYISIRTILDGKEVVRFYSPVSRNSDHGHLDLMIKIEENTTNKPMERYLSELKPGDLLDFKGPMGGFEYHRNMYRQVGMIAGGTGITPMVQIIRSVANHPEDDTELFLLYGNYNEDDILCRDELSYYSLTRSNISVYISLVNPPGKWSMGTGFVSEEMIKKALPAPANDIIILLCGPPPMIKANIAMLKNMGYADHMIFSFV